MEHNNIEQELQADGSGYPGGTYEEMEQYRSTAFL